MPKKAIQTAQVMKSVANVEAMARQACINTADPRNTVRLIHLESATKLTKIRKNVENIPIMDGRKAAWTLSIPGIKKMQLIIFFSTIIRCELRLALYRWDFFVLVLLPWCVTFHAMF